MAERVFNEFTIESRDFSRFYFTKPDEKRMVKAYYVEEEEKEVFHYETNRILLVNGLVQNERGDNGFVFELNNENQDLAVFFGTMDEYVMGVVVKKWVDWFGDKVVAMTRSEMEEFNLYKSPLRVNGEGRQELKFLRVDDDIKVRNENGKKSSLENIRKNMRVKLKIRFNGIVIFRDRNFKADYSVVGVKYFEPRRLASNGFGFQTDGLETEADTDYSEFYRRNEDKVSELMKCQSVEKKVLEQEEVKQEEEDVGEVEDVEITTEKTLTAEKTLMDDSSGKDLNEYIKEKEGEEPREVGDIVTKTLEKIGGGLSLVEDGNLVGTTTFTKDDLLEKYKELMKTLPKEEAIALNMEFLKGYTNYWELSSNSEVK